jgi:hypothetical protein
MNYKKMQERCAQEVEISIPDTFKSSIECWGAFVDAGDLMMLMEANRLAIEKMADKAAADFEAGDEEAYDEIQIYSGMAAAFSRAQDIISEYALDLRGGEPLA